ncbi:hypothetical protein [Streptomyces mirabilis]|uniref:hypothetical protein n=1 Tax=Streptomyces mirabilis TaxID=68239 RepID=UPI00369A2606
MTCSASPAAWSSPRHLASPPGSASTPWRSWTPRCSRLNDTVLDRYGDYAVVFDASTDAVSVFTALGQWVGMAESPDAIGALIAIHERVNGGDA